MNGNPERKPGRRPIRWNVVAIGAVFGWAARGNGAAVGMGIC